jgi:hypothetical protein
MSKQKLALRDRVLEAMRACPRGKRLEEYAADIKRCRTNVEHVAGVLHGLGLVIRMRAGVRVLWTAAEHADALALGVADEKERQRQRLEQSGVLAERKKQRRARKQRNLKAWRARRAAEKPKPAPVKREARRYDWPDVDGWTPPQPRVASVWELARVAA